jgi:two-component system, OmpR family, sensor kinase
MAHRSGRAPESDDAAARATSSAQRITAEFEAPGAGGSDGALTMLMAVLSHELRLPVHALNFNLGVCLDRLRGANDVPRAWMEEKLARQQKAVWRLRHLIDTFLDVAQISSGRLRLELAPIDLREVTQDVVGRLSEDLSWAGCACDVRTAGPVVGNWDKLQLDVVLTSLVSNAMRYGAGRPVRVSVRGDERHGYVSVRDEGEGIPPEDQARIFDKFVRLGPSDEGAPVPGLGLGLWIVKHIVETMGGSVSVESAPGQGATFTVTLPR